MTLRKKTLIIVGVMLIGLIAILYVVSESILLNSYLDLEKQNTEKNVQRVLNALSDDLSGLATMTNDWATWDDTYKFIEDGNEEYIKANPTNETIAGLRVNVMFFINSSGEIVFSKGFDPQKEEEVPAPESLQKYLSVDSPLVYHPNPDSSVAGLLLLPEGPMLISSEPILTSQGEGPIRGALVWGRYLDSIEIARVAETTRLSLTVHRMDESQMPSDFEAARSSLLEGETVFVHPLNSESVAGYSLLSDVYGTPILILRADMPRGIYQQGQSSLLYFVSLLVGVGLAFVVVMLLILEKLVLSPLSRLSANVSEIGDRGDLSERVSIKGSDELSRLGGEIDKMLAALEQSQKIQAKQAQELGRSNAELSAVNKELEAFSYSVSHDLRAPLRSIDGFSKALLEDYVDKLDAQGKDYLQRVRAASQRMAQLIDDLLNLSRVTRGDMRRETVNLSALAQTIALDLKNAQPERQAEFIIADGMVANGDARLLKLVLENLLSNAWKFTEKHPSARIEFGAEQYNGKSAYFVRDDGAGFEMAYVEKLFTPFQRLHAVTEFPGTGIGLALVQRIIHRHGGHVWARGEVGKGATFYFTL